MQLPKKIWFLWLQGFDDMPYLVQKCWASWQRHNPDWEIIFLDKNNIYEYIDVQSIIEDRNTSIYAASRSDIIRINLLAKYGGIWVDATCFCQQPLDNWLHKYLEQGFFAFHRPGYDRMFSSWFLAAYENNPLVKEYCKIVNEFWPENKNIKMWQDRPWVYWFLLKFKIHGYLKKNPTLWYHPILLKWAKVYPYFWFFYLFEKAYHANDIIKKNWDAVPKLTADIPHKIWLFGYFKPISESIKNDIDQKVDPLYKLTFKYDSKKLTTETTLDYLLNTI
jgi:Mannosyltransferase OCH1 and related enzymes